ncbi:MAG: hypothetical protein R3A52_16115 [Polyangiales bacterium]
MARPTKDSRLDEASRDALRAAWELVEPQLQTIPAERLQPEGPDPRAVLAAAQPVAAFVMEPESAARFAKLPAELFDPGQPKALAALVGALRWAVIQRDAAREAQGEAVLDDALAEKSNSLRTRMSKVVLHYFEDDPEIGPSLKNLGRRRGHAALAQDLRQLAALYEQRRDVVERDPKYWQPGDIDDARAAAGSSKRPWSRPWATPPDGGTTPSPARSRSSRRSTKRCARRAASSGVRTTRSSASPPCQGRGRPRRANANPSASSDESAPA